MRNAITVTLFIILTILVVGSASGQECYRCASSTEINYEQGEQCKVAYCDDNVASWQTGRRSCTGMAVCGPYPGELVQSSPVCTMSGGWCHGESDPFCAECRLYYTQAECCSMCPEQCNVGIKAPRADSRCDDVTDSVRELRAHLSFLHASGLVKREQLVEFARHVTATFATWSGDPDRAAAEACELARQKIKDVTGLDLPRGSVFVIAETTDDTRPRRAALSQPK